MLLLDLIRLGRFARDGARDAAEVIDWVTSITDPRARQFFRHVFVVEIVEGAEPAGIHAFDYVDWTSAEVTSAGKETYIPDVRRAVVCPIVLPSGGNPRAPQGSYGIPAYPVYDKDFRAFQEDAKHVIPFLRGRLDKTVGAQIEPEVVEQIALQLHERFAAADVPDKEKAMAIIALCDMREGKSDVYRYSGDADGAADLRPVTDSRFRPGTRIEADLGRMVAALNEAKFREGATAGSMSAEEGWSCSSCGKTGDLVSSYSKAWPWMTPTWSAPLPETLGADRLVEAVALCRACYEALTYGASLLNRKTSFMQSWITREIFSPSMSAGLPDSGKGRQVDNIYAAAYALPLLDSEDIPESTVEAFIDAFDPRGVSRGGTATHLAGILGMEATLPDALASDHYRLSVLYFSGDPSRADIHLRAYIEDVLPSVAAQLEVLLDDVVEHAVALQRAFNPNSTEKQLGWIRSRYGSLPFLLANAYGGGYVWQALSGALHRRPLTDAQLVAAVSSRLAQLSHRWPDSVWDIGGEVVFYQTFMYFLTRYTQQIALEKGDVVTMRPWKELQEYIARAPLEELDLDGVEELGFACGQLVGDFAAHYYVATRQGNEGKDFLKERVLTFGASLTPELIVHRAMRKFEEYAARVQDMKFNKMHNLLQRRAVVLTMYVEMEDAVKHKSDKFMLGFWTGYSLSGHRRRVDREALETETESETEVGELSAG